MAKVHKVKELDGKQIATKEETESLRGKIIILNPEESEIAKRLDIKEKGVYGVKVR